MEVETLREPDAIDERRQRYLANLAALYRSDSVLAAQIDALPFAQTPALEIARDGHATVRLIAADGCTVYAHSRYRPGTEASKFVEGQLSGTAGDKDDYRNPVFVIAGLGLGYHLVEFERFYERPLLIVAEDDAGLIKAAFCAVDLSELLAKGRLIFLTSTDKAALHGKLEPINTNLMLGFQFVALPYTSRRVAADPADGRPGAADFHQQIRALISDYISYSRLQMITLLRNARVTCKNIAFNLPTYLDHAGIERFQNRAAGYPAILVAAGPSLARHLDRLGELRERAVIIAVQTVFKLLLARGIRPHFVTSLDFHEVSAEFFRGVEDVGDTVLVAEPKATWHVLDGYPGQKHVLRSQFIEELLRAAAPARGGLKAGSTVAHLAFYLAEYLGCDPIILVGQDLSYSEGFYYPPGMPIEQIWRPELGRFQTVEMKQWERIVRGRPILRVVQDIHGRDVYTDDQLFTYAEQFQSDFLASPARVIHAGEAGMRLAGTEVMALDDAAAQYCQRSLPAAALAAQLAGNKVAPAVIAERRRSARQAIEERLSELASIRKIATEMNRLLANLGNLVERPAEFNRLIVRVDDLRSRIQEFDRTYKLVTEVSQAAELRRYTADRRIGQHERETRETARRHLQRDRDFVTAFQDGCEWLEAMLKQSLKRIGEVPS
ncbi:MAG: DUF115 domain-containing protein [Planctomycetes bacterium]|nr:DUF115 domain-containing protein [Planctomycetota bacterium]